MHSGPTRRRTSVCPCFVKIFLAGLLIAGGLSARPIIYYRAVVNAASFAPPGTPSGNIAQGSIFTIFGEGLGPEEAVKVSAVPIGTELAGVSVPVTQGDTVVAALPLFVVAGQINVLMPSNAPLGDVIIRVTFNGETSNSMRVRVVEHSFGVFTATQTGIGPGILFNYIGAGHEPVNSLVQVARPGQVITLWGTGFGPIEAPDNQLPPAGDLPFSVEVIVGGVVVNDLAYAGRSPCCAGIDQLVFTIPEQVPLGCWVPVQVRVEGRFVSNTVTMAISQEGGSACEDPAGAYSQVYRAGGSFGGVTLIRSVMRDESGDVPESEVAFDFAAAGFGQATSGPFTYSPLVSSIPPGTCTAWAARGVLGYDYSLPTLRTDPVDAGGVTVTAGGTTKPIEEGGAPNLLTSVLGVQDSLQVLNGDGLFLDAGEVTVSGSGGGAIGAFDVTTNMPGALNWQNRDEIDAVKRNQPLQLSWTAAEAGFPIIIGANSYLPINATGMFVCVPEPGAASFTIPDYITANLPISSALVWGSRGLLVVGVTGADGFAPVQADGLDFGGVQTFFADGKVVTFE